jgi:hypothetical protein
MLIKYRHFHLRNINGSNDIVISNIIYFIDTKIKIKFYIYFSNIFNKNIKGFKLYKIDTLNLALQVKYQLIIVIAIAF